MVWFPTLLFYFTFDIFCVYIFIHIPCPALILYAPLVTRTKGAYQDLCKKFQYFDLWITNNKKLIKPCPKGRAIFIPGYPSKADLWKSSKKFHTPRKYNKHFPYPLKMWLTFFVPQPHSWFSLLQPSHRRLWYWTPDKCSSWSSKEICYSAACVALGYALILWKHRLIIRSSHVQPLKSNES